MRVGVAAFLRALPFLLVVTIAMCAAAAQEWPTKSTIRPSQIPGLALVPHESAGVPAAGDPLGQTVAPSQPFAYVLVNRTTRSIAGVTITWSWRDVDGRTNVKHQRSDGLLRGRSVLAAPGSTLLVTPEVITPFGVPPGSYVGAPLVAGKSTEALQRATDITISLDAIIFDDGEVAGPDESRYLDYIQARTAAAHFVSRSVLALLREGKDSKPMLSELRRAGGGSRDYAALWRARFAGSLLDAKDLTAAAEELGRVSEAPLFRKQY